MEHRAAVPRPEGLAEVLLALSPAEWLPPTEIARRADVPGSVANALLERAVRDNLAFARRREPRGPARWEYKARREGRRTWVDLDVEAPQGRPADAPAPGRRVRLGASASLADLDLAIRVAFGYPPPDGRYEFVADLGGARRVRSAGPDVGRFAPANVTVADVQAALDGTFRYVRDVASGVPQAVRFADVGSAPDDGPVMPTVLPPR